MIVGVAVGVGVGVLVGVAVGPGVGVFVGVGVGVLVHFALAASTDLSFVAKFAQTVFAVLWAARSLEFKVFFSVVYFLAVVLGLGCRAAF